MCDGRIERSMARDANGRPIQVKVPWWFWNLFGAQAVFLLAKDGGAPPVVAPPVFISREAAPPG